jgi:hypothetical protein
VKGLEKIFPNFKIFILIAKEGGNK